MGTLRCRWLSCTGAGAVLAFLGVVLAIIANSIVNWSHQVFTLFTMTINIRWSPWTACYGEFFNPILMQEQPAACDTSTSWWALVLSLLLLLPLTALLSDRRQLTALHRPCTTMCFHKHYCTSGTVWSRAALVTLVLHWCCFWLQLLVWPANATPAGSMVMP